MFFAILVLLHTLQTPNRSTKDRQHSIKGRGGGERREKEEKRQPLVAEKKEGRKSEKKIFSSSVVVVSRRSGGAQEGRGRFSAGLSPVRVTASRKKK